jgi:hypothetical protein
VERWQQQRGCRILHVVTFAPLAICIGLHIPTPHTQCAAALSRLEDESQLVVRAALALLRVMIGAGIFQPPLRPDIYLNTLRAAESRLAALGPVAKSQRVCGEGSGADSSDDGDDEGEQAGEEGGVPQQGGSGAQHTKQEQVGASSDADADETMAEANGITEDPDGAKGVRSCGHVQPGAASLLLGIIVMISCYYRHHHRHPRARSSYHTTHCPLTPRGACRRTVAVCRRS